MESSLWYLYAKFPLMLRLTLFFLKKEVLLHKIDFYSVPTVWHLPCNLLTRAPCRDMEKGGNFFKRKNQMGNRIEMSVNWRLPSLTPPRSCECPGTGVSGRNYGPSIQYDTCILIILIIIHGFLFVNISFLGSAPLKLSSDVFRCV